MVGSREGAGSTVGSREQGVWLGVGRSREQGAWFGVESGEQGVRQGVGSRK